MHLIFFDEVKNQKDYPHYHLGAICIHEKDHREVEHEVNSIAQNVFGKQVLKRDTEFHANDVYHRKGVFKEISSVDQRIEIVLSLARVLERESVKLIDIQINTENLYNQKYAADYAFMFLCEKSDELMRSIGSFGLLIGDRENDHLTNRYSTALSEYRVHGTEYKLRRKIDHLFESVHFTPSHLSRFLQLADVYSWILQYKRKNRTSKNGNEFLLRLKEINLFPAKYKSWPS
jgi:hypothetical protein